MGGYSWGNITLLYEALKIDLPFIHSFLTILKKD